MNLVIVESPSKAKTIAKYLGKDYIVDASGGHIRDLPVKTLGVDIKNNFEPEYQINPDKKAIIKRLSKMMSKAENVYLATDPDREGEAISWHLAQALDLPTDSKNRIVFNEISPKTVKQALESPRSINIDLVDAQQARRVLDRLVGYKISPLLCKKIQNNLSAGRVQSVALRIIIDREVEINEFVPKEYWNITAILSAINADNTVDDIQFKALLSHKKGKRYKPESEEQALEVVNAVKDSPFSVKSVKSSVSKSHAPAPFTTSTLQQDASNKLGMPSPTTMSVAQNLYEGVNVPGEGQLALVTYIRTDSTRISADAQNEALKYIKDKFGSEYVPSKPNIFRSKKSSQDAHEAIRPIALERTPESLKDKLQRNHHRLYKLIYDRFLASQMTQAQYSVLNVEIQSADYTFKSTGKTLLFKGYTAAYEDFVEPKTKSKLTDEEDVDSGKIPLLTDGQALKMHNINKEQKFTKPPQRYSDASLIKVLEEKGIGRPSTYASIIAVLLKREYTVKEGKYLKPTELAFLVNELMVKYFDNIVDVTFTARMEEQLDEIEEGGKNWQQLIADFYPWLEKKLKEAQQATLEVSEEMCPECNVNLLVRVGKYGKFLGCPNYPKCRHIQSLPGAEEQPSGEKCDKCGSDMLQRTGKYGKYLACSNYPDCKNIKSENEQASDEPCEKCQKNMVIRSGKYGKYLHCSDCRINKPILEKAGTCPKCGKPVYKRFGKSGKPFYGCSGYPDCDFISWDAPTDKKCPECEQILYMRTLKSGDKYVCHNKECSYEEIIKAPEQPTENAGE